MATLQITVFEAAREVALGLPLQEMAVSVGVSSTQSAVITGPSRRVQRCRIMSDSDCWVTWGENPTALNDGTDGRMMGANNPEYFAIEAGWKVAVIERT